MRSTPNNDGQVEALFDYRGFRVFLCLQQLAGDIAGDLNRLGDGAPLGNQPLDIIGGGQVDALWQALDMQAYDALLCYELQHDLPRNCDEASIAQYFRIARRKLSVGEITLTLPLIIPCDAPFVLAKHP